MKKRILSLLALTMVLSLLAGCGKSAPAPTEPAAPTAPETQAPTAAVQEAAVTVTNIDELLAALDSNREIRMEAGTYDLTTAADYGQDSKNPAYTWIPAPDGYQLNITGLQNLIIQGAGKDSTSLVTLPRLTNVVVLNHCQNVTLRDLTAGHTEGGEMCSGAVLRLEDCMDVNLEKLGLYGCGTIGVDASGMENLRVSDCDIYDCSFAGIRTYNLSGMEVNNCRFYDLGEDTLEAASIFMLQTSKGVTVSDCQAHDNNVMTLLDLDTAQVTFRNCDFTANRIVDCGFSFFGTVPVFENVKLEGNDLRSWYRDMSDKAVDPSGNVLAEDSLPALKAQTPVEPAGDRIQVHVSTPDEFLAAIASNTEIILDAELYDLSLASDYGKGKTETYQWAEQFDGPELIITNVENLVITSADGDQKAHTISATPRYADVLTFQKCSNVKISGFTAGHTKEPGSCAGGVINFEDSDNVTVENCGLFGCGIIGVQAQYCGNVNVIGCDIYECSQGGISMWDVNGVNIENCTFRDLGSEYGPGYEIHLQNCKDALVDGEPY